MWTLLLTLSVAGCGLGLPVLETTQTFETTTDSYEAGLQRDVNTVSYIQNFKKVMTDHVYSEYKHLTIHDMEKVQATLEEFLGNFARDLRETIDNKNNDDVTPPNDGMSSDAFEQIKKQITVEFPEVKEDVAEKIVTKLRRNLLATRIKLDGVIRESYNAGVMNS